MSGDLEAAPGTLFYILESTAFAALFEAVVLFFEGHFLEALFAVVLGALLAKSGFSLKRYHPTRKFMSFLVFVGSGAAIGAVVGGATWAIVISGARRSDSAKVATAPTTPPVPMVRIPYSSTQVIEISSSPGNYNESLNLDNVATMIQGDEANQDEIGMVLLASPPLKVDKPTASGRYKDGGGDLIITFPKLPGVEVEGLTISGQGTKYIFNRFNTATHTVQVGARRFKIMLQSIRNKSTKRQRLMTYTFGISEE